MPTPSSDPPPDPPSPQSLSYAFSTCPDEIQTSSNQEWDDATGPGTNQSHESHGDNSAQLPASVEFVQPTRTGSGNNDSSPQGRQDGGTGISEGRTSLDPSSRVTTMSPRPHSAATSTAGTSPASEVMVDELHKRTQEDSNVTLDRVIAEQSQTGFALSGRRSPDQSRSATSQGNDVASSALEDELYGPSMGLHFPSMRTKPVSPSSFLRPGSKFVGLQKSEKQQYNVQVDIKHVDMRESFICGYLRIQGLTEDHPTLTTYFEGEIIGSKYNFFTNHESWGANRKTDLKHWKRFSAFHPYRKQVEKGPASVSNVSERENIFMRWKEHFLVPDHRIRTITGASFEGFYYICFNQIKGEVSGIYFHSKSEKFQNLELAHVPDRGCFSAVEFR